MTRKFLLLSVYIFIAILTSTTTAIAQVTLQPILNPDEPYGAGDFGAASDMDGDTLIVGASSSDTEYGNFSGAVLIYQITEAGTLVLEGKLYAPDGYRLQRFGNSVAISGDTAVVGAKDDKQIASFAGAAYVFTRSNGVWSFQQKLAPTVLTSEDYFGTSVDISGDTIIVGAPKNTINNVHNGAAYLFSRTGNSWVQNQKIIAPSTSKFDFGIDVAIDGNHVTVKANNSNFQGIDIFSKINNQWVFQEFINSAYVFSSVSMDSERIVFGIPTNYIPITNSYTAGSVTIYKLNGSDWQFEQRLSLPNPSNTDYFGSSVYLDGKRFVATSANNSYRVVTYLYNEQTSLWEIEQTLTRLDESAISANSIALSDNHIFVGAKEDVVTYQTDPGFGIIFSRTNEQWLEKQTIIPSDSNKNDYFGFSVSLSGNTAAIGALRDRVGNNHSGSVSIFTKEENEWLLEQQFAPDDGQVGDDFGSEVILLGDTLIASSPLNNEAALDAGAVYVFAREGISWTQEQKILPPVATIGDAFGTSFAVFENTLAIGKPYSDSGGTNVGVVYIYSKDDANQWVVQQTITPPTPTMNGEFGYQISLSFDTMLISDKGFYQQSFVPGIVYIYQKTNEGWLLESSLLDTPTFFYTNVIFGACTAIDRNTIAVSLHGPTSFISSPPDFGKVYTFTRTNNTWTRQFQLSSRITQFPTATYFGISLAVRGDTLIVGAANTEGPGSLFKFNLSQTPFPTPQVILPPDTQDFDNYGNSVSLDGDQILVGAPSHSGAGYTSGKAYIINGLVEKPISEFMMFY